MKKKLLFLVPVLLGMFLSACGGGGSTNLPEDSSGGGTEPGGDPTKSDFVGVSFESATYTYDGQPHILAEVSGAPENTTITYTGREEHVDAGTYNASAKLVKDGYNDKTLNATLTINKANISGVTFSSQTVTYDGQPHTLTISGDLPTGGSVSYTNNGPHTNAGTYNASAVITAPNYNDLTLNAVLTISKATFTGYTYESKSVKYDGAEHINDIQLVGTLPQGTTVNETVKNANNEVVTSAIEVGTYTYTCVISNSNYVTETLTATLTIKAQKKDMPVFVASDGTVYFANGLHNSYLYSLSSGELNLIDYSSPKEFNKYSPSSAIFIAGSTLFNSVKQVSGGSSSVLYTDSNIDDFVKYSDNVYYYSSNALKAAKSGIYKVDATDSSNEPVVTRVFEGKSDNLAIYGGNLYFTNGNDHNYLYKMNLSSNATSLVMEEKVHEFTINNNILYCTVNGLLNDYIGYLDLSSSSTDPTKLTNAAGEFLTVKNGYLYYNYTDLFSAVDDSVKGVWRISTSGGNPEQLLANDGVNGFDVESSTSLVYVDSMDLHLYRYNTSTHAKTDLLDGFVAPESTPLNTGGQTISLGTKTYYLNMYAGKTLYCYDESSKKSSQLTTNKVEDFYIYNGIMYFNQVTMLTNNDLYAVNLTMGGEAEKLNSNDVRNMVSDGTYLYATHYNWAGAAGGMSRMRLDGSEYVKFSEVNGAKNLTIKDGKLYYINCGTGQDNGYIEYMNLTDITSTTENLDGTRLSNNIKNVKQFAFDGNNIFYIYNGIIDNSVRRTDFTSLGEGTKLASSKTNPNEILLNGNYVYYYSYAATAASSAGFYRVSKDATGDGTQELLVGYDSKYYGSNLSISDSGNLYFLNYIPKLLLGDAHFYQIKLSNKAITKIN